MEDGSWLHNPRGTSPCDRDPLSTSVDLAPGTLIRVRLNFPRSTCPLFSVLLVGARYGLFSGLLGQRLADTRTADCWPVALLGSEKAWIGTVPGREPGHLRGREPTIAARRSHPAPLLQAEPPRAREPGGHGCRSAPVSPGVRGFREHDAEPRAFVAVAGTKSAQNTNAVPSGATTGSLPEMASAGKWASGLSATAKSVRSTRRSWSKARKRALPLRGHPTHPSEAATAGCRAGTLPPLLRGAQNRA